MQGFQAVLLGIVEGMSEFLPVSSTGHLILASRLLGIGPGVFVASFEIAIQLGAILAVVVLYWKRLWRLEVIKKILAAFVPTAVVGLFVYKAVKRFLMQGELVVLASLFLGGVFLIVFERMHREPEKGAEDPASVTYGQAVLIGVFQAIAMIPGVSRSAATISGGLLLGLKRKTIVEFSFLLAVPTMLAASALDLLKSGAQFSGREWGLLGVGFAVSFAVAFLSIRFLLGFIRNHSFIPFGVYRVAVAAVYFFAVVFPS